MKKILVIFGIAATLCLTGLTTQAGDGDRAGDYYKRYEKTKVLRKLLRNVETSYSMGKAILADDADDRGEIIEKFNPTAIVDTIDEICEEKVTKLFDGDIYAVPDYCVNMCKEMASNRNEYQLCDNSAVIIECMDISKDYLEGEIDIVDYLNSGCVDFCNNAVDEIYGEGFSMEKQSAETMCIEAYSHSATKKLRGGKGDD